MKYSNYADSDENEDWGGSSRPECEPALAAAKAKAKRL